MIHSIQDLLEFQFLKIIQAIKSNEYVITKRTNEDRFSKKKMVLYITSSKTILINIVCIDYIFAYICNNLA